jgi:site-specific DNA recombinase
LEAELQRIKNEAAAWIKDANALTKALRSGKDAATTIQRLSELHESIRQAESAATDLQAQIADARSQDFDANEVDRALESFDPVWDALTPQERAKAIHLLVERVDYDGAKGTIAVTFHPTGLQSLATELTKRQMGAA